MKIIDDVGNLVVKYKYEARGRATFVAGGTIDCINNNVWYAHFHADEQQMLEGGTVCYDETIFCSVERNWSG